MSPLGAAGYLELWLEPESADGPPTAATRALARQLADRAERFGDPTPDAHPSGFVRSEIQPPGD